MEYACFLSLINQIDLCIPIGRVKVGCNPMKTASLDMESLQDINLLWKDGGRSSLEYGKVSV
jgi:hypothetical protein